QGGTVRLTGGELATGRGDVRWAGAVGGETYLKMLGSYTQSDDFYRARNQEVEYSHFCTAGGETNCLRREAVPLALDEDELWLANVRVDHYFGEQFLTVEGGTAHGAGPVIQTGI